MTNILQVFPCKADVSCLLMACGKAQRVESWKEVGLLFRHSVVFNSFGDPMDCSTLDFFLSFTISGTSLKLMSIEGGWGEIIKYWGWGKAGRQENGLKGLGEKEGSDNKRKTYLH